MGEDWYWDVVKLLELHREVGVIGGRIFDHLGLLVRSAACADGEGGLFCPTCGQDVGDPGPFAISLKPHCVAAVPADLMVVRAELLKVVFEDWPQGLALGSFGLWIGLKAAKAGRRVVYTPR